MSHPCFLRHRSLIYLHFPGTISFEHPFQIEINYGGPFGNIPSLFLNDRVKIEFMWVLEMFKDVSISFLSYVT